MMLFAKLSSWHHAWLKRRIPSSRYHVLNRHNIFIFPSKVGFGFLLLLCLLWLLGTNYQNNLVIMLVFLLLSLMHTCIYYTYRNFSGLSVELKSVKNGFAGDVSVVTLLVKAQSKKQHYHNIVLHWQGCTPVALNLQKDEAQQVVLQLPLKSRGWFTPRRLTVSTRHPLGLLRAWTHLDIAAHILVYPKPIQTDLPDKQSITIDEENNDSDVINHPMLDRADDISHLRDYQEGDSPRHIAWKTYAKGQGLATKVYESVTTIEQQQWLEWDSFSGMAVEERLSRLCDCVLQAERKDYIYGLKLPGKQWPLASGPQHKEQLLRALALYGKDEEVIA